MTEVWKRVEWAQEFEVSTLGNVRKNGVDIKPYLGRYLSVYVGNKLVPVHRIVATVFLPNPEKLPVVNHKDGVKHNNSVTNLEWCTKSHDAQHSWDKGLNYAPNFLPPNKKCKKCGNEWLSRMSKPKTCPKCKSYNWDKENASKKD